VPTVNSVDDVGNIDEEFLVEAITTEDEDDADLPPFNNSAFGGFSYNEDDYK